eukprot:8150898-Pyramimonas_sp.AAC.1
MQSSRHGEAPISELRVQLSLRLATVEDADELLLGLLEGDVQVACQQTAEAKRVANMRSKGLVLDLSATAHNVVELVSHKLHERVDTVNVVVLEDVAVRSVDVTLRAERVLLECRLEALCARAARVLPPLHVVLP